MMEDHTDRKLVLCEFFSECFFTVESLIHFILSTLPLKLQISFLFLFSLSLWHLDLVTGYCLSSAKKEVQNLD